MKTHTAFIALLLLLLTSSSIAQQTGRVSFPNLGLSFNVPVGWMGQEGEGYYLIGHNSIPGIVFIVPHSSPLSVDQMMEETTKGLRFDAGTMFRPSGTISTITEHSIAGEFEGTYSSSPAKAYIIGMSNPKGNGLTIVAVTTVENYTLSQYKSVAVDVMESVTFTEVKGAKSVSGALAGSLKDWKYQIGNTKLTFSESYYSGGQAGGGYNMKEEIHLCSAGHFLYYDQSMVAAGGTDVSGYSGGSSQGHGTWDIQHRGDKYVLILSFNNGKSMEYALAWGDDDKLYMNGSRYYRTWEGEYAPDCF